MEASGEAGGTHTNHTCVLVVDDEEDIRETLRDVVEMAGYSAVVAANGAEGLKLLEENHPCLLIVDLQMPVMTGGEMIQAIRRHRAFDDLQIVVSTSLPDRAPAGVPVLPKPVHLKALWDWIEKTCHHDGETGSDFHGTMPA